MTDARSDKAASANVAADSRPAGARPEQTSARPAEPHHKSAAADAHATAAAASIDELLAKEALANLKRTRATAHLETLKSQARMQIPPAKLVVRPAAPYAWKTPFISLAVIVGISTSLCAGGLAYLFLQPVTVAKMSDAELRNMRDTVAQLRRNVADLSNEVTTTRTALAAINKAASDRLAHFAPDLDRGKRDQPLPAGRLERKTADGVQITRLDRVDPAADVTGSVQPSQPPIARPEVIPGWRVRRAYDGLAVLEGQYGVIEVVLGQDVPQIGRIQDIKYENGRWQVLTTNGVITSVQ
jgi:hypothetical protein